LDNSDFTKIIQPVELVDVYHPADDICQSDVFDDLSTLGYVEPDLCLSGPDTVVGKDSDFPQKLSKSFDVKPQSNVALQLNGYKQSYSALSDSGCTISIIKQSVFEAVPIKLRSAFGQSVRAGLVRLDARLDNLSSESPFLPVTFAVVKQLAEDVILPRSNCQRAK